MLMLLARSRLLLLWRGSPDGSDACYFHLKFHPSGFQNPSPFTLNPTSSCSAELAEAKKLREAAGRGEGALSRPTPARRRRDRLTTPTRLVPAITRKQQLDGGLFRGGGGRGDWAGA